jgi:hypothetical protein
LTSRDEIEKKTINKKTMQKKKELTTTNVNKKNYK